MGLCEALSFPLSVWHVFCVFDLDPDTFTGAVWSHDLLDMTLFFTGS